MVADDLIDLRMEIDMTKLNAAKTILLAAGWTHILSSTGNKSTGEYGLLFTKNGEKLWLNNLTIPAILAQ